MDDLGKRLLKTTQRIEKTGELPVFIASVNRIRQISSSDKATAMSLSRKVLMDGNELLIEDISEAGLIRVIKKDFLDKCDADSLIIVLLRLGSKAPGFAYSNSRINNQQFILNNTAALFSFPSKPCLLLIWALRVINIYSQRPYSTIYTSRFATDSACFSINSRRGSTWSPISVVKISSAATTSSIFTCNRRRVLESIVVSHN